MFVAIQRRFPVCCASDEFYYFPQVAPRRDECADWACWDDFTPASVAALVTDLLGWESTVAEALLSCQGCDERADLRLLARMWKTLREQLSEVRPHASQPTFHLTVATTGLVEALDAESGGAFRQRLSGLPGFLANAGNALDHVPPLFRDMGIDMAASMQEWLGGLPAPEREANRAQRALGEFRTKLETLPTVDSLTIPSELLDRIVRGHMGCGMGVSDVLREIDTEIEEATTIAKREASRLAPGVDWPHALEGLQGTPLSGGDVVALCRSEVSRLERRCIERGYLSPMFADSAPVSVVRVPKAMEPVRAAAAYASIPGSPPAGGTFFVLPGELCRGGRQTIHPEFRITAAHETYPGHHLLDIHRWALQRPVRRHVERPLFYEGWACFAESLAERDGLFAQPGDRLILAGRRLRRAIRGKVDLGLQTGDMDVGKAAGMLVNAGYTPERATDVARRYALRPGYQVCYTIGQRTFDRLFDRYGAGDPLGFARTVLNQGEIGFDDLERAFTLDG